MAIVADDKDWTWVLERPCPDCGFDASTLPPTAVADGLRDNAGRWRSLLDHPAARRRPAPDQWSALEYACHVRDVYRRFVQRLGVALEEDDPLFANWDQDATAVEDRYGEQDPVTVLAELEASGREIADRFAAVEGEQWQRPARRSDGARFTVATLGRYLLHDPVHHVWDVEQGYARMGRTA